MPQLNAGIPLSNVHIYLAQLCLCHIKTPLLGTMNQNQGTFGELSFSFTKVTAKTNIIELSH